MSPSLPVVLDVLRRAGVPHALIGASAMAVRGVSRATDDVDLLVRDQRVFDPELWKGISNVDIRLGDAADPLAGVVRLGDENSGETLVDIVVPKYLWMDSVLRDATEEPYAEERLPVATRVDLVLLKLFAGGYNDRNDVSMLLSLDDDGSIVRDVDARIVELDEDAQAVWHELKAALHL